MKVSRYTKLGILVIFSIAILIWGINYLKGIDFFKKNTTYHVIYDHIDGLLKSSAVNINGYQVGQVKDIEFSDRKDGSLLVSFSLEGNFKLPRGSVARIVSSDIMGTKSIKLLIKPGSNTFYQDEDTIPGSIEGDLKEQVSMQVLPLKNKAEQLLASLDSAITVFTYIFNKEARKNLSESFAHINETIQNLRDASGQLNNILQAESGNIHTIMENLSTVTTALGSSSGDISNISKNISSISDSLARVNMTQILDDLAQSAQGLNQIIQKINNSEGTAGMLINNDELYTNLTQLSLSLDNLLNDIRNNPKRYVHFSAFDLGKEVYITPGKPEKKSEPYIFRINLISSSSRLNPKNAVFNDFQPVEEVEISGVYNYLTGSTTDFNEISKLSEKARKIFPDAGIVAFKNGRQVNLEKALRKSGEK